MMTIFFGQIQNRREEGLVLKRGGDTSHTRAHAYTSTHNKQAIACLIICFGKDFLFEKGVCYFRTLRIFLVWKGTLN